MKILASIMICIALVACEKAHPPICIITSPSHHSVYKMGDTIPISISASDSDGLISEINLYLNNQDLTTLNNPPYDYALNSWEYSAGSYLIKAIAIDNDGLSAVYKREVVILANLPTVTTNEITGIDESRATCGGEVMDDGGDSITSRGVCWSTSENPTIADSLTLDGFGTGTFTSSLSDLSCGTTYYVRAFATNSAGTAYGSQVEFTTSGCPIFLPTVTTTLVSNISDTTAQSGGTITDDGGASLIAKGVCWSNSSNPTIADNHTNDGTGNSSFSSTITGLKPNTTYYVRAYGTNSEGKGYGNEESFKTGSGSVTDYDGNVYQTVVIGDQTWMAENLKVTHYSDGTSIPLIEENWDTLGFKDKAYCWYDNIPSNGYIYGALYTWSAAMNNATSSAINPSGIHGACPDGWHLPSDAEWTEMIDFLGGSSVAGGKLKKTGTTHWYYPNTGATNESGFSALPSGYRSRKESILFWELNLYTSFWSSTEWNSGTIITRYLVSDRSDISLFHSNKIDGHSVRCIKD